ncbi:MAG: hypothetical protein V2A67_10590 [Bacteroidota bacterium]
MKTKLLLASAFAFLTMASVSCMKDRFDVGEGFEIYLTVTPYSDNLSIDYSQVDLDTFLLQDTPILRYNDLLKYDTITHTLTLGISHDSLEVGNASVYGRMFMVTVDSKPIYCGFKWPVYSSVAPNWVFIEEPFEALDSLNDNEIIIKFMSDELTDPRLDKRIVDKLKADGKIE